MVDDELYKVLDELVKHATKELDKIVKKADMTVVEVDNATKALCLIEKATKIMDGDTGSDMYSERSYDYYMDRMPMSYERGRSPITGRYVSRDGGSYARGDRGYSGHSINDRMIANLESMMDSASSDYERQLVKNEIERLRRER